MFCKIGSDLGNPCGAAHAVMSRLTAITEKSGHSGMLSQCLHFDIT